MCSLKIEVYKGYTTDYNFVNSRQICCRPEDRIAEFLPSRLLVLFQNTGSFRSVKGRGAAVYRFRACARTIPCAPTGASGSGRF